MNEEAMTPDNERVVEPLSAPHTSDEWRAFFRERGWVITMDDRPGQAFDAFVHNADSARTASVAGLDAAQSRLVGRATDVLTELDIIRRHWNMTSKAMLVHRDTHDALRAALEADDQQVPER